MDKDLILSEEKGERKLMVHDSRLMVKGVRFKIMESKMGLKGPCLS